MKIFEVYNFTSTEILLHKCNELHSRRKRFAVKFTVTCPNSVNSSVLRCSEFRQIKSKAVDIERFVESVW